MGKVALITGASSGIGAELARIHANRRGDLVLVARREDRLNELKGELEDKHGVSVLVIAIDLRDEDAPQQIYDRVVDAGIKIDYLMNNAGFGGRGYFTERDWSDDRGMIQVNVIALTTLTRLFLPGFLERDRGKILNTSSTAAFMPGPLQAVYYATKAYVTSFSNALAEEVSGTSVTVTALMPGATESEFAATSGMDATSLFTKTVSARSVANAGYKGMLRGKLDVVTGLSFGQRMVLALSPFIPKRTMLRQIHEMQKVD